MRSIDAKHFLLAYPASRIFSLGGDGIDPVAYEDTEHVQVVRRFLMDHRRMLGEPLDDAHDFSG
ncbi:MAG TPA: hypothetical protein VFQ38_08995 [Longimicrobiales bacterium]|nr:hypothetical protein [Longimicrobiales bacterium]